MVLPYANEPSDHDLKAAEKLVRIADANHSPRTGDGIADGQPVRICDYAQHQLAEALVVELGRHGIDASVKQTRTKTTVWVPFADRAEAHAVTTDFRMLNPDVRPKRFTRDYDLAGLCILVTIFSALMAWIVVSVPGFPGRRLPQRLPLGVATSGLVVAVVVERCHRILRVHRSLRFSSLDLLFLTSLLAVNVAVWRFILLE